VPIKASWSKNSTCPGPSGIAALEPTLNQCSPQSVVCPLAVCFHCAPAGAAGSVATAWVTVSGVGPSAAAHASAWVGGAGGGLQPQPAMIRPVVERVTIRARGRIT
jgi:hypothetical protein